MTAPMGVRELAAALDGRIGCPGGDDWERLIGQANRTMTIASLGAGLAANSAQRNGPVPEDANAYLTCVVEANRERNRRLMALLEEVLDVLAQIGVMPILLKGAALLVALGEPAMRGRIMGDLDLMLPAGTTREACNRLREYGFEVYADSGLDDAPIVLFRDSDVGMVDLHGRMKGSNPRFDHALLAPHCRTVRIGGQEALLPSPAAQAALLTSHDQLQELDYWRGLIDMRHLHDLAQLARSADGIDWQVLDGLFTTRQAQRALRTQLLALKALFRVPVPRRYSSGLWPRIQHRRQLLQADRPRLRWPLTLVTLALEWPRGVRDDLSAASQSRRHLVPAPFLRGKNMARKAIRSPGPGKFC
ncbi:nucleotidyltransferase family protein [Novosphingobium sp. BL-8H]|uniref:nucleotidyltransferase family protein n=1 Tax=Novosphingobium sp. BL-8H TaxID=3127640 RepID=UPI003757588B